MTNTDPPPTAPGRPTPDGGSLRIILADPPAFVPVYDRQLAGALAAAGHHVTLATGPDLTFDAGPPPPGVTCSRSFGRLLHGPAAGRAWSRRTLRAVGHPAEVLNIGRRARSEGAVLHLQWSLMPLADAWWLSHLARSGVPVVYTAHNVLPHEPRPWQRASFRVLYAAAPRLVVHSRAARERLVRLAGPRARRRVHVVPMGAGPVPRGPVDRAAARRRLGLGGEPLALFVGHVRPYKGLDDLLAAWPEASARATGARLAVAGTIAGGRRQRERLSARAASVGAAWRPGPLSATEISDWLAAADVVVLPYRDTDDSAVAAMAQAHGRAVVATDAGGLPEALLGRGGLLVPRGRGAMLAAAVSAVLVDGDLRERLEMEARLRARTWAEAGADTVDVYRLAVADAREGRTSGVHA